MTLAAIPEVDQISPAPAQGRKARRCQECGASFIPASYQQQFCSKPHKVAFQNRQAVEGRAVIALVKAWRAGRNVKGSGPEADKRREVARKALSELCSVADAFMADDRTAGRVDPLDYASGLLANGFRYMDRQRKGAR